MPRQRQPLTHIAVGKGQGKGTIVYFGNTVLELRKSSFPKKIQVLLDPPNKDSKLEFVLGRAAKRGVRVRILLSFNMQTNGMVGVSEHDMLGINSGDMGKWSHFCLSNQNEMDAKTRHPYHGAG